MTPQPRNAFHQNLAIIEGRQQTLDDRIGELRTALPDNSGVETALKELGGVLAYVGDVQAANGKAQAEALGFMAVATQRVGDLIATQVQPARDAPAVLLYLGVDADGSFDQRSYLGQLLIRACGDRRAGLAWLFHHSKVRKADVIDRESFVENARRAAASSQGLEDVWSDYDFGRFHDLAPCVLRLIEAARPAPSSAATPPDEGAAQ